MGRCFDATKEELEDGFEGAQVQMVNEIGEKSLAS